jgi:hypothetical protein
MYPQYNNNNFKKDKKESYIKKRGKKERNWSS